MNLEIAAVVDLVERNANWGGCCRLSRADGAEIEQVTPCHLMISASIRNSRAGSSASPGYRTTAANPRQGAALLAPAGVEEIGGAAGRGRGRERRLGDGGRGSGVGVGGGAVVPTLFCVSGDPYSGSAGSPCTGGECCR